MFCDILKINSDNWNGEVVLLKSFDSPSRRKFKLQEEAVGVRDGVEVSILFVGMLGWVGVQTFKC